MTRRTAGRMPGAAPGIRRGVEADVPTLRGIERAAGEVFRELGMDAVADDEPPSPAALRRYLRTGALWIARDAPETGRPAGRPVAYVLLQLLDGLPHVEQLSVHPDRARRGIGAALLDHVAGRAAAGGHPGLTLTTFADVPWNAPYYERLGFRRLPQGEIGPGLRAVRRAETEAGLDRWPRVCMRRDLHAPAR